MPTKKYTLHTDALDLYFTKQAALKEFEAKKSSEISRVCHRHYSEFIDSVEDLMKMRADMVGLKDQVGSSGGGGGEGGGGGACTPQPLELDLSHLSLLVLRCEGVLRIGRGQPKTWRGIYEVLLLALNKRRSRYPCCQNPVLADAISPSLSGIENAVERHSDVVVTWRFQSATAKPYNLEFNSTSSEHEMNEPRRRGGWDLFRLWT